jgi:hypothetical protein
MFQDVAGDNEIKGTVCNTNHVAHIESQIHVVSIQIRGNIFTGTILEKTGKGFFWGEVQNTLALKGRAKKRIEQCEVRERQRLDKLAQREEIPPLSRRTTRSPVP